MPMITTSEYGIVAVNKSVISKLIIDRMLAMDEFILPCNKKGKLLKKGIFTGFNEFLNSVELTEHPAGMKIKLYYVSNSADDIDDAADRLFDGIASDFDMLCLDAPSEIIACIKGIVKDNTVESFERELVRHNE